MRYYRDHSDMFDMSNRSKTNAAIELEKKESAIRDYPPGVYLHCEDSLYSGTCVVTGVTDNAFGKVVIMVVTSSGVRMGFFREEVRRAYNHEVNEYNRYVKLNVTRDDDTTPGEIEEWLDADYYDEDED